VLEDARLVGVDRHDAVGPRRDGPGDRARRDRLAVLERAVLSAIAHVGEHGEDLLGAGLPGGVLELEELHVGFRGRRRRDHDGPIRGVGEFDQELPVREPPVLDPAQPLPGCVGERCGEGLRGRPREDHVRGLASRPQRSFD
jgi:hypothetical protein